MLSCFKVVWYSGLMQVRNFSECSELVDGIRWLQVSTMLIDGLIQPAFMKWIEEERALENGKINEVCHHFELPCISTYWLMAMPPIL